jgi:predicted O-methyltransferase YrrM
MKHVLLKKNKKIKKMNNTLIEILKIGEFYTKNNQTIKIHSHTKIGQCQFLQQIIETNKFTKSLEIGFAFGISALAITESIMKNNGQKHTIIDKFENQHWNGVGIEILEKAGFSNNFEFYEEYCYNILPRLLNNGRKFDFAYIDSTKQFDWLLNNFFYIDKMLDINGIIVLDDVNFPGIRKLARLIHSFPSYEVYDCYPYNYPNTKKQILSKIVKLIPFKRYIFKPEIIETDFSKKINCNCVAFKKTEHDLRNWDWHKDF